PILSERHATRNIGGRRSAWGAVNQRGDPRPARMAQNCRVKREGRRLLGGTGAATAARDWGESLECAASRIDIRCSQCTPQPREHNRNFHCGLVSNRHARITPLTACLTYAKERRE